MDVGADLSAQRRPFKRSGSANALERRFRNQLVCKIIIQVTFVLTSFDIQNTGKKSSNGSDYPRFASNQGGRAQFTSVNEYFQRRVGANKG